VNGQWVGRYTGTNAGLLVIDLDDMGTYYQGSAYAYDDNKTLPSTYAFVRTTDKSSTTTLKVAIFPLDGRTNVGTPATWEQVASIYPPGTAFPRQADVNISTDGAVLKVDAATDIGTSITAEIPKSRAGEPTEYEPLPGVTTWEAFKAHVGHLPHRGHIFRGQERAQRLRTGFHRTGRADIPRYLREDVQALHRHLSSRTTHIFNLSILNENGAFLSLVQHHGYPTPLLDWTYSPFVAAFFAYHRLKNVDAIAEPDRKVRIFLLDHLLWSQDLPQLQMLIPYWLNFSIVEFIAINNERMVPQQSISTVTNVDDIESYVRMKERERGREYLKIIDLPYGQRPEVMRDLSMMGITAGSLFPGLDGACEELRERFF
jgi:hypothetical protein